MSPMKMSTIAQFQQNRECHSASSLTAETNICDCNAQSSLGSNPRQVSNQMNHAEEMNDFVLQWDGTDLISSG
jgi:hypothetical protein